MLKRTDEELLEWKELVSVKEEEDRRPENRRSLRHEEDDEWGRMDRRRRNEGVP
jgi:hypothetical protein